MISLAFAGPVALAIISLLVALIMLSGRIDRLERHLEDERWLVDQFMDSQVRMNKGVVEFQREQIKINERLTGRHVSTRKE